MQPTLDNKDFLNSFDHLGEQAIDEHSKNLVNLFVLKTSANSFDYNLLISELIDPLINYSISRKIRERYKNKPAKLSKKAREKFVDYLNNKGELGELLLYCFLESHLDAPKILSKLELKTSTNHYVNGSDGVHFLKLKNGNYQLIFCESKTIEGLTSALSDAFKSIHEFKNEINSQGNDKSGLPYEKSLINDHLEQETFSDRERDFIESIIYPKKENSFEVDDAFGIFVGYQITVTAEDKKLPNAQFREKIKNQIKTEIEGRYAHIAKKIEEYELEGHNFYIYVLPFTELNLIREKIQKEITS